MQTTCTVSCVTPTRPSWIRIARWLVLACLAFRLLVLNVHAEETHLGEEFSATKLVDNERLAILKRTRFLRQDAPDRLQVTADVLQQMNALPTLRIGVDNATFYLTRPLSFFGGRQIALAFVEVDDIVFARVLYRSNSQFTWRMCDATDGGHIGKGFHEFDKQVPIPVSVVLLASHNELQELKPISDEASQPELANSLLRGLTLDRKSPRCISQHNGHYYTREYAAFMPSQPMEFSIVSGWLSTSTSLRVADPARTALPAPEQLPNLSEPVAVFTFESEAYSKINAGDAKLTGRVFVSLDGDYRYLFFEDATGRAALSSVEALQPQVNAMGLRGRYLNTHGMDAPLMEYYLQIPKDFGGTRQAGYRSNWNYVRELPIIRDYYTRQEQDIPNKVGS